MDIYNMTTQIKALEDIIQSQRPIIAEHEETLTILQQLITEGDYDTFSSYRKDYDEFTETMDAYQKAVTIHNEAIDELNQYQSFFEEESQ